MSDRWLPPRWPARAAAAALVLAGATGLAADRTPTPLAVSTDKEAAGRDGARVPVPNARPGGIRSLLDVPDRMTYGAFVWRDEDVPPGKVWVRIDREAQIISVFRAGHEIGTAVVLYGAMEKPTPAGRYPILAKYRRHRSSLYDADMPYTLRLTHDGISVHASDVREGAVTHGCIGLPDEFARRLFEQVRVGDPVLIV